MALDVLITALTVMTVLTWTWSINAHFKSKEMPQGAKLITFLVITCAIVLLSLVWVKDQPVWVGVAGAIVQLLAYALFWYAISATKAAALLAAFTHLAPGSLVVTGPYRYVRHPFYTSYLLSWGGLALSTWSIWALAPLVAMFVTYNQAAKDEEHKFSQTDMANEYGAYAAKTARFIPGVF